VRIGQAYEPVCQSLLQHIANKTLMLPTILACLSTKATEVDHSHLSGTPHVVLAATADTMCNRCTGFGHLACDCLSPAATAGSDKVKRILECCREGFTSQGSQAAVVVEEEVMEEVEEEEVVPPTRSERTLQLP
jgi:hypothetical protein